MQMNMDMMTHLPDAFRRKIVTADAALKRLKNGSRVFIGSGCGEPRHLIHAMVKDPRIQDIMIFQMLAFTLEDYLRDESFLKRFQLKLFFVTMSMRQAAYEGKIDYIPTYLSEIPHLFRRRHIGLDVALIQISPPDRFGLASLGISVDVTREAVRQSPLVIAQVNPRMPRTHGDSFIHVKDIDCLIPFEEPLLESPIEVTEMETARRIARYVSDLIDDGCTIQAGYGQIPYALLEFLDEKNDLGLHTHMISDQFIPLFEKGIITNRNKNFLKDRAVSTFCMGSRKSYDYIDNNPTFYFGTADFINNPSVIGRNDNFISITSALEVDLTGQACSDSVGRLFFSGTGDQANFIRGAALSRGGLSIIALPSTAMGGKVSRIVGKLSEGAGLASLRSDVNYVVTEYGIAQLRGKSIYQRTVELAQIAHPDFREALIESAKRNHYIFADQLPPRSEDLMFLEEYKSRVVLKNGKLMNLRPLLPSDEIAYRNFFYSLKEDTVYLRFFRKVHVFSHQMAQDHWAGLDYRKNISLIGLVQNRGNNEIMAVGTYVEAEDDRAEVAFVVREDFQGMGIASYLLEKVEAIARQNGFKGFTATILPQNTGMLHVFQKRYPGAVIHQRFGEVTVQMDFED